MPRFTIDAVRTFADADPDQAERLVLQYGDDFWRRQLRDSKKSGALRSNA